MNVVARAPSDAELATVERALLAAIDDLRSGRIEPAALARAQKRLRLEWAEVMNSPQELAFTVGHYQTMDGWRALPELIAARDRATVQDVQRVAGTYFVPSNRVIAVARAEPPEGSGPSWLELLGTEGASERGGAR
jgi:zinc protease